ncbi:pirin family protein [Empedobacter stercoris]|uniref:Nuclease PIN n=1 Tax=Empedobacter stercoris TaxID=1628248 RepID=A0ABX1WK32_9FLAO|nr:pirin family protein [Empedobacter stercoris]MCA4776484.1 pirin family protein [Empedobacter stercoris]NOJ75035.1 nuclease PIN [Empedobacter stercoris]
MIEKIGNDRKVGNSHIKILYPGSIIENSNDSGVASIGRIDHANISGATTIKMHPHINDDILSYFRAGYAVHTDSEGFQAIVSKNKLMLMKAGKLFFHEEAMPEPLEGLQIFIRPKSKDLKPEVVFQDLNEANSVDSWRLLASPTEQTQLQFSSETWIYDTKLTNGKTIELPDLPTNELTGLLYVFQGNVMLNNDINLQKGESVLFKNEQIDINALETSELVLFFTDENSEYYDGGMYSGNKH